MIWTLDTEFIEWGNPGTTHIDLISIGLVCQDGREYYAESSFFKWDDHVTKPSYQWLKANVKPHLVGGDSRKNPFQIQHELKELLSPYKQPQAPGEGVKLDPEIWAYFADYDWVTFCGLFGRMVDLPDWMPKWCRDLKQYMSTHNIPRHSLPPQTGQSHNALDDARWNMTVMGQCGLVPYKSKR